MLANRHGAASIVALLVLSLLIVVGSGLALLSMTDIKMAGNYRDGVMAQYLAEAGAKRAIAEIRKSGNGEWTGESRDFDSGNYGGKSQYEVLPVEKRGIDRIITSTGAVNTSTRTVVVAVSSESPYQYVAYSGDNMNLEGLTISGNIGSNKNIRVSGGTITGSIDAVGYIYTYGIDAPQKKEGVKAMELPSFNPAVRQKYKSTGQNANIFEDNSQRYTFWEDFTSLDNELYYVETRYPLLLSLENIRGPGIIYCTEDILIAGATVANNAILISEKNITVTEGLVDKVFFVAGGDVDIILAQFGGSAVAGGKLSIVLTRNGADKLETIEALTNPLLPSAWVTDKIQIKTWNSYE
jgi:Tfp pilus assembly protein PilX